MPAAPCLHAHVGAEGETLAGAGRYCGAGRVGQQGRGEAMKGETEGGKDASRGEQGKAGGNGVENKSRNKQGGMMVSKGGQKQAGESRKEQEGTRPVINGRKQAETNRKEQGRNKRKRTMV